MRAPNQSARLLRGVLRGVPSPPSDIPTSTQWLCSSALPAMQLPRRIVKQQKEGGEGTVARWHLRLRNYSKRDFTGSLAGQRAASIPPPLTPPAHTAPWPGPFPPTQGLPSRPCWPARSDSLLKPPEPHPTAPQCSKQSVRVPSGRPCRPLTGRLSLLTVSSHTQQGGHQGPEVPLAWASRHLLCSVLSHRRAESSATQPRPSRTPFSGEALL